MNGRPLMATFIAMAIDMRNFRVYGSSRPSGAKDGPQFDMTPDGRLLPPPSTYRFSMTAKLGGIALLVALFAGAIGIAALALWIVAIVLPVVIVAGAVAYGAFRFQLWRRRGSIGASRRPPTPFTGPAGR